MLLLLEGQRGNTLDRIINHPIDYFYQVQSTKYLDKDKPVNGRLLPSWFSSKQPYSGPFNSIVRNGSTISTPLLIRANGAWKNRSNWCPLSCPQVESGLWYQGSSIAPGQNTMSRTNISNLWRSSVRIYSTILPILFRSMRYYISSW